MCPVTFFLQVLNKIEYYGKNERAVSIYYRGCCNLHLQKVKKVYVSYGVLEQRLSIEIKPSSRILLIAIITFESGLFIS